MLYVILLFFFPFPASRQLSGPRLDSGQAVAEPFWSHTHFHVIPTCRRAQNCQTLSTALDAMCNSFNTRPCRYPYQWCNGVLMPPCILRACTRQLVIRLIDSARSAVDRAALASCWRPEYGSDTQHPSSFRGDLRVAYDSITASKTSFTASYLQPGTDVTRDERADTWRREKQLLTM